MPRDTRETRNALAPLTHQFAVVTLGLLLLLGVASAIFVYQVSPLRDPLFQPNSANAGSLLPWMRGVNENTWMTGAALLAGLLVSNMSIVSWQWIGSRRNKVSQFFRLIFCVVGGIVMFVLLYLTFVIYLLAQWLVD
jgi:hypothetical protein